MNLSMEERAVAVMGPLVSGERTTSRKGWRRARASIGVASVRRKKGQVCPVLWSPAASIGEAARIVVLLLCVAPCGKAFGAAGRSAFACNEHRS
jgi:hypothetical protein